MPELFAEMQGAGRCMGLPVRPGLVCDSGQGVPVNRAGLVIDADGVEACLFGGLRRLKGVLENHDLGGSGVQTPGSLKKYVGVVPVPTSSQVRRKSK